MNDVIVNVSVGGSYPVGQARMVRSLDQWASDTSRIFWDRWPGKSNQECQCGFKVDAFDEAMRQGYDRAVWLDSQVIAVASLDSVWQWLDQSPVLQLEDGWNVGQWTSDRALSIFGVTRDAAMNMPMSWAKVIGINFRHPTGAEFLDRLRELRDVGAFDGPWHVLDVDTMRDMGTVSTDPRCRGHRYDQSCISWLAFDMGIKMAPKGLFISTYPDEAGPIFVARGNTQ